VGVGDATASGGLVNLRLRAEELGGTFDVEPADPRGTRLSWRVPT